MPSLKALDDEITRPQLSYQLTLELAMSDGTFSLYEVDFGINSIVYLFTVNP